MPSSRQKPVTEASASVFEEIRQALCYAVTDRRVELSMTQAAFGELVRCPSTSISNIESKGISSSGSRVSMDRLVQLLLASGLTREDIARIVRG